MTHDGSGNVVQQPTRDGSSRTLTYFPSGAVRTIVTPSRRSAVFRYDGSGAIAKLDVKGPADSRSDHRFGLIQRRNAIVDGVSQSILVRQIPGAGGLVASRRGAGGPFVFPFGEERGTRFVASNDQSVFVQDVSYRPFGEATSQGSSPSSPYYTRDQWNGGDLLADFGVVHLGARIYDPVIGRFLSRDPLIIPRTASTTNPYAFAFNDPINVSDPSGLDPGFGVCATSSGGPCASAPAGVDWQAGLMLGAAAYAIAGTLWGNSGSGGPAGPSLLSKDAFDTTPIAMWPQWQSRDFLDRAAGGIGFDSFDQYLDVTAEGLGAAEGKASSINPGLFPIAGTASLFLDGEAQLVRGIRDERRAARRGDFAGMSAAKDDQAIGLVKTGIAIASIVGVAAEVGAVARTSGASGAGGSWATVGEQSGGAVAQLTPTSCGAACGEMVAGVTQIELIASAGAPTNVGTLARALGGGWRGGYVGQDQLPKVLGLRRPFIAELYESGAKLGHFVVVDGLEGGHLLIRDPWAGGTTYRMLSSEFERVWTGNVVFR